MAESFIPNTVKLKYIELKNYKGRVIDITDIVYEINIYENIYVNTITGTIDVMDSNELIEFFPIIGEESLDMELLLPGFDDGDSITLKKFRIHKITDREIKNNKLQSYKLWFSSPELISNIEQRICKAWREKTATKIINDVYSSIGSDKKLELDESIGVFNYIATNMNPFQVFNYIASQKSINNDKLSDFAFFESLDQKEGSKFHFKSIGGLAKKQAITEFNYSPFSLKQNRNSVSPLNIENINFRKGFDVLENKLNGLYNQTHVYYDLLRKRYVLQKNTYDDVFNETKEQKTDKKSNKIIGNSSSTPSEFIKWNWVNDFPQRISLSKEFNNVINKGIEKIEKRNKNEYINSHLEKYEKSSSLLEQTQYRRAILLNEYENNKIFLNDISGNYNYNIGKVITFKKPHIVNNNQPFIDKYGEEEDLFISGNYIIVKNRHRISRSNGVNWSYKNYMEVTKNTIKNDLNKL